MDEQKQRVIDSIKQANNILVTVKNSPSIDQLSACIALTLIVNELGKHGTAVFSGQVPSILDFLEPEKTIERNTDSLRDFIISLDKAKADKLRYKVEDKVVKIFITPYRTSLSGSDLEFGQGDFNVDVVIALGVHEQNDLDEAITAHGRILHDATVISMNTFGDVNRDLGSVNWTDSEVSSLSEMVANIAEQLGSNKNAGKNRDKDGDGDVDGKDSRDDRIGESVIDNQVATALLTGIVAETERFGNAKTKPETMEVAAKLLTAGANQELVASHLSEPATAQTESNQGSDNNNDAGSGSQDGSSPSETSSPDAFAAPDASFKINNDGELSIDHPYSETPSGEPAGSEPTNMPTNQGPVEPAASAQPSLPPVYDPGQSGLGQGDFSYPGVPSGSNSAPDITAASPDQLAPHDNGEDLAALDFLKEHKVDTSNSRVLQPLHDQNHLEGLPKIGPALTAPSDDTPKDSDISDAKYAITPPSMGGTLTANMPSDDEDTAAGAAPSSSKTLPTILHHGQLEGSAPTAPATPAPTAVATHESPEAKPVLTPAPVKPTITSAGGQPPKLEAAPSPDAGAQHSDASKTIVQVPTGPQLGSRPVEAAPLDTAPMHGTLADLEAQVHSPHTDSPETSDTASQKDQPKLEATPVAHDDSGTSPLGAADMPAPSALKLPSPQTSSSTDRPQVSALAPPPPVPPPIVPM